MLVVDIKMRDHRFVARFKNDPIDLVPFDYCLVDIEGDQDLAKVKTKPYEWQDELPPEGEAFVLRKSEEKDFDVVREHSVIEQEAYKTCLQKIRERELPMCLAGVEKCFDGNKLKFFFTADNRIDFRELVKDLASVYRTRIEMRQIGVRDRSKKVGGYGICGQELCCSRFLQKFEPITIRMAKDQNLALNPTKISGLCGRLMCCMAYEVDSYVKARKQFPREGTRVDSPHGEGVISSMNYVQNTINIFLSEERRTVACRLDEITVLAKKSKEEPKSN